MSETNTSLIDELKGMPSFDEELRKKFVEYVSEFQNLETKDEKSKELVVERVKELLNKFEDILLKINVDVLESFDLSAFSDEPSEVPSQEAITDEGIKRGREEAEEEEEEYQHFKRAKHGEEESEKEEKEEEKTDEIPPGTIYSVFVGNLPPGCTEIELKQAFESCGTIISSEVAINKHSNECRGFGFVDFDSVEGQKAALACQGKIIRAYPVRISIQSTTNTEIFVCNFPEGITEDEAKERIIEIGGKAKVEVKTDLNNNRLSATASYANNILAQSAKRKLHTYDWNGEKLTVAWTSTAQNKDSSSDGSINDKAVFVNGFDERNDVLSESEIRKHFEVAGPVTEVRLVRDSMGMSRGFGFISFATEESAKKALRTLNNSTLGTMFLKVSQAFQRSGGRGRGRGMPFGQRGGFPPFMSGRGGPWRGPQGPAPLMGMPPPAGHMMAPPPVMGSRPGMAPGPYPMPPAPNMPGMRPPGIPPAQPMPQMAPGPGMAPPPHDMYSMPPQHMAPGPPQHMAPGPPQHMAPGPPQHMAPAPAMPQMVPGPNMAPQQDMYGMPQQDMYSMAPVQPMPPAPPQGMGGGYDMYAAPPTGFPLPPNQYPQY